ncbi:MAG TPA: proprotein convertase P-domain-containing protein, partial [Myxococcota bacterium]|nr:proprotein convertase P-domain-containing protein [Myxococcota bacterium]
GWCRPATDHARFTSSPGAAIPDGAGAVEDTIEVSGLTSVPEDVIVTLDIDHPNPSQLRVVLTNLYGTPSVVWDHEAAVGGLHLTRAVGFAGDESVNGPWTLVVQDNAALDTGVVRSWGLELTSRYD